MIMNLGLFVHDHPGESLGVRLRPRLLLDVQGGQDSVKEVAAELGDEESGHGSFRSGFGLHGDSETTLAQGQQLRFVKDRLEVDGNGVLKRNDTIPIVAQSEVMSRTRDNILKNRL